VRDFRLSLELAAEASGVEISEWLTDATFKRSPLKVKLADESTSELEPDGVFSLELSSGQSKKLYLEIDRGTHQSPAAFRRKIRAYLTHIGQRPTPVLYVVPDEARRAKISSWIRAEALACSGNLKLFAVALREDVSEESILQAPIWQVVRGPALALLPTAQEQEWKAPEQEQQPLAAIPDGGWLDAVFGEGMVRL
jgi:hypothetical protein